jgi:hypothetical protein
MFWRKLFTGRLARRTARILPQSPGPSPPRIHEPAARRPGWQNGLRGVAQAEGQQAGCRLSNMLSQEQFAAIGRLTLAFNRVEAVIDGYAGLLLGATEVSVAGFILGREQNVDRKVSLLAGIIKAILSEHPGLAETAGKATSVLQKVKLLAERRNSIVHSLVATDQQGNAVLFNKWEKVTPNCDVESLDALAKDAEDLAMSINISCGDLEQQLGSKRTR